LEENWTKEGENPVFLPNLSDVADER